MIRRISLTTDFSAEGSKAFLTALALAVFYSARLEILHVSHPDQEAAWGEFPKVRDTLTAWGLLPPDARREDVFLQLGVEIGKVEISSKDPVSGIAGFLQKHSPDLLVAASHGRTGINWWLSGSVAVETLRRTSLPTLLLGPDAQPFINAHTGRIELRSILFPVAASPAPMEADRRFRTLLEHIPAHVAHVHVSEDGHDPHRLGQLFPGLRMLQGDAVPGILKAARDIKAGLIVMPTGGRHGFIDALRGSVTQRVLREAPCPILSLPSASD